MSHPSGKAGAPSFAHVVNPVIKGPSSDLYIAQPVSFEALKNAKEFSRGKVEVRQYAAAFPEDFPGFPAHLEKTRPLKRSILDFQAPANGARLPLIKDILDRLYQECRAGYMIYTNVDITPMPYFYDALAQIAGQGYDAFIVNRRTIPSHYSSPSQLPSMYAEIGEIHPGCDCFVFKRELYPKFILGNVVIGREFFGLTLRTNLAVFSENFKHFRDLHMTFHIGDDRVWQSLTRDAGHNKKELESVFAALEKSKELKNKELLLKLHQHFLNRIKKLGKRIE